MFFFAFFGALFYVRVLVGPWLAGEGEAGAMNHLLWEGFEFGWPMMQTPQEAVGGVGNQVIANCTEATYSQLLTTRREYGEWNRR